MSYSPWGTIQSVEHITRGVSFVHTAGHGGIRITDKALKEYACDYDYLFKNKALQMGSYLFFEEDCDAQVLLFDCPRLLKLWCQLNNRDENVAFEQLKNHVKNWHPDYFNTERD